MKINDVVVPVQLENEIFKLSTRFVVKSKGLLHAGKSKVKTVRKVDDVKIRKLLDLADQLTPSWRLDQMMTSTFNLMNGGFIDRTKMGEYIKAVMADVVKEETNTLLEAEVELKDIAKYISDEAKKYFFECEKEASL